jgi:hypothetical protein
MLTDEALVQELEAAFRDETEGLRYAGRVPSPRRPVVPWTAVPIAAAAAAVLVLPQLDGGAPASDPGTPSATSSATATLAAPEASTFTLVTRTVELAGYTFSYQRATSDSDAVLHVSIGGDVPADAEPVPLDGPAKAWVGTDPRSGEAAIWLQSPTRASGQTIAISSPDLDRDALVSFLRTGEPS